MTGGFEVEDDVGDPEGLQGLGKAAGGMLGHAFQDRGDPLELDAPAGVRGFPGDPPCLGGMAGGKADHGLADKGDGFEKRPAVGEVRGLRVEPAKRGIDLAENAPHPEPQNLLVARLDVADRARAEIVVNDAPLVRPADLFGHGLLDAVNDLPSFPVREDLAAQDALGFVADPEGGVLARRQPVEVTLEPAAVDLGVNGGAPGGEGFHADDELALLDDDGVLVKDSGEHPRPPQGERLSFGLAEAPCRGDRAMGVNLGGRVPVARDSQHHPRRGVNGAGLRLRAFRACTFHGRLSLGLRAAARCMIRVARATCSRAMLSARSPSPRQTAPTRAWSSSRVERITSALRGRNARMCP